MYELAKHPAIQEDLRAEIAAARAESQGDMLEMLKRIPLVKGALKETLRCEITLYVIQVAVILYNNEIYWGNIRGQRPPHTHTVMEIKDKYEMSLTCDFYLIR